LLIAHHYYPWFCVDFQNRCRKWIVSVLSEIEVIVQSGDVTTQETIGESMENICRVLIYYVREPEVQKLLDCVVQNIPRPEASVRRAAAKVILALCKHYPKSQIEYVVRILQQKYHTLIQNQVSPIPLDEKLTVLPI
jgi:hypothetical protein